jgi:hypothetical protein
MSFGGGILEQVLQKLRLNKGLLDVRRLVSALLIFCFAFSPGAYATDQIEFESGQRPRTASSSPAPIRPLTTENQLVVQAPIGEQQATITVSETETNPEQLEKLLADPKLKDTDVLLSTDRPEIVNSTVKSLSSPSDKRLLRIIPIGKLASAKEKLAAGFRNYKENVRETLMNDRIGLFVLTVNLGISSYIWLHASSYSIHQKTSMLMLELVMAATFGLDRDLWGKINKPVKEKLIRVFDRFIPGANETLTSTDTTVIQKAKVLASQFSANLMLGVGIQVVRTSLLSLDHLHDVITTGSFWLTAVKLSSLVTLTTFAWSELYSGINAEETPVAKTMLKRMGEARGIIMAQLASVSMVLQPHVYGSTPIYSYIIHGTLGVIALMNAHRIVTWLENNPVVKKVYKKIQTFENYINAGLKIQADRDTGKKPANGAAVIRSCNALMLSVH